MAVTAKEIAQKLGLSTAAVSLALNNKSGISESTRNKVLQTAQEMGYTFRKQHSSEEIYSNGTIVFLLYRRHGAVVGNTPFFAALSEGISNSCRSYGYRFDIQYVYENHLQRDLHCIYSPEVKGIILLGTEMQEGDMEYFENIPCPMVVLDNYYEGIGRDCVLINNVQGAFLATNYLISVRECQPGYLRSSYSIGNFDERADGFYKAVRHNGMSASASIVHYLAPSVEGAYQDMKALLKQHEKLASCYFADNDLIAAGAMRAFREAGYQIPKDIAIIGFDNTSLCEITEPTLTTINVPKHEMGYVALQRLLKIIAQKPAAHLKIELETSLVKRNSL